jgi:hypothetical protein
MVIFAKFNKSKKKWEVDEDTCNYYVEFRNILEKHGANAIAFIILYADPTSPFAYEESESVRRDEVYASVFGKEKFDVEVLKNAIKKYQQICDTQENKLRKSYLKGGKLLSSYIDGEAVVSSDNLKDIITIMKELPTVITTVGEINKSADTSAKDVVGKVKSNRSLSFIEEKNR